MRRPKGPTERRVRPITLRVGGGSWMVWYRPWRGCTPPIRVPDVDKTWIDAWKEYYLEVDEMKRPTVLSPTTEGQLARVDVPVSLRKLPRMAELLVQPAWEEGGSKGQRALFIFLEASLVKLLVKLESPPLKLMVSGRGWDEAWAALEVLLGSEDVPWELDMPREDKGGKKRR